VSNHTTKKLVVFASGSGSNFEAVVKQLNHKRIGESDIEIPLLICDKPEAYALVRAEKLGIPTAVIRPKDYPDKASYERAIVDILKPINPDYIALAGYMRIIGPTLLNEYEGRIVNLHPALLPAFPGKDGIGDALKYGVKVTGITVHFVDAGIDTGKIIAQKAIEIKQNESEDELRQRIHALEHQLYPKVLLELLVA